MKKFDNFLKKEKGWVRLFLFMTIIGFIGAIKDGEFMILFDFIVLFFFIYSISWFIRCFLDKS